MLAAALAIFLYAALMLSGFYVAMLRLESKLKPRSPNAPLRSES